VIPDHQRSNATRGLRLLTFFGVMSVSACVAHAGLPLPIPVPPGRLIDLGGYKLHLNCMGRGNPTVVLSAGAGDFSFDWSLVQPKVARISRVCSYDRSGEAWSDLGPKPRTPEQEAYDLHRLLAAGGESGPFVLVGHSLGGMIVRLFAENYPKEAAGAILVDSFHEDSQLNVRGKLVRIRMQAKNRHVPLPRETVNAQDGLQPEEIKQIDAFIAQFLGKPQIDPPFDRLPADVQRMRLWAVSQRKHYAAADDFLAEECAKLYEEDSRLEHPLGGLPLIVLSRSRDDYPPDVAVVLSKEHQQQQLSLARLSRAGKLVIVPNSGHHIQIEQPDAVVAAIGEITTAARRKELQRILSK